MSKNSSVYFFLWLLIQLLIEINCQMAPFKPLQRRSHTVTFIDNKLFILGGVSDDLTLDDNDIIIGKQFFYLDASISFNTQELLWNDLTSINLVPPHAGAASVNGGANNNTLVLFGGLPLNFNETMTFIYTFNAKSNLWRNVSQMSENIVNKRSLTGIADYNGKMYLFDGASMVTELNDMLILDTINLNWKKGSSVHAPTPRYLYGATFLPNQHIIYLGK